MVTVIALKPHSPDGSRKFKKGERYQISAASAKVLVAMGRVRMAEEPVVVEKEPPTKKSYSRRDLRADE